MTDPSAVLDLIGSPAQMDFRGPDGVTFMTGDMVETANVAYQDGEYVVAFQLNDEGGRIFAEKTAEFLGRNITI